MVTIFDVCNVDVRKRKRKTGIITKLFLQMGRVDGFNNPQNIRKDTAFAWTNVYEKNLTSSAAANGRGVFIICLVLCHALISSELL